MDETCCDVLGKHLPQNRNYYANETKSGKQWIPAFVEYVDPKRCIGCGLCVKVCLPGVYEMKRVKARKVTVKIGDKKVTRTVTKVAVVVNPDTCFGDCHCHMICPVDGGAMICKPKELANSETSTF